METGAGPPAPRASGGAGDEIKVYLRWGLVIGLVVFVSWLLSLGSRPEPAPASPVDFPLELRASEKERQIARRTLPQAKPDESHPVPRPRDPLLAAIGGRSAVVIEVNALRNSPIGEMWLACLRASDPGQLDLIRDRLGIDPVNNLDRFAFGPDDVVATGHFADVRWDQVLAGGESTTTHYGDQGSYTLLLMDGGAPMVATRWGDQLFSIDGSVDAAKARIDRLEGRGALPESLLGEGQTYGDAYGVVEPTLLGVMLAELMPDKAGLQSRLLTAATTLEFHLDASHDLALTAEVHGKDAAALNDLARYLSSAFTLWRLYAQTHKQPELAALLDQAKVTPGTGTLSVQLALPLETLRARLANCGKPK